MSEDGATRRYRVQFTTKFKRTITVRPDQVRQAADELVAAMIARPLPDGIEEPELSWNTIEPLE